ncbi:MAG: hypothetical protein LBM96_07330 [Methanobrevibacter sp.]|jgi:hypothetical protein|nr:hypothetical protein [Candidatus Methanoflexus mossambicus]
MSDSPSNFDWGSLIQTVVPTIGKVVGGLLGINSIEEGVIEFKFNNAQGEDEDFSSIFCVHDGIYKLFNQSGLESDVVTISFPSIGSFGTETIAVPGGISFELNPLFNRNANQDSTKFELIGSSTKAQANGGGVQISCSGREIPVGDGKSYPIGSYLSAQVEQNQITISSDPDNQGIISLPMASVNSSGDTSIILHDIPVTSNKEVQIPLPEPLNEGDHVAVGVTANVDSESFFSHQKKLLERSNDLNLTVADKDFIDAVKKAPRLNF